MGETLFADVSMTCDMTHARGRVLCLSPDTVAVGTAPHLTSWIYLEWQQVKDIQVAPQSPASPSSQRDSESDSDDSESGSD